MLWLERWGLPSFEYKRRGSQPQAIITALQLWWNRKCKEIPLILALGSGKKRKLSSFLPDQPSGCPVDTLTSVYKPERRLAETWGDNREHYTHVSDQERVCWMMCVIPSLPSVLSPSWVLPRWWAVSPEACLLRMWPLLPEKQSLHMMPSIWSSFVSYNFWKCTSSPIYK